MSKVLVMVSTDDAGDEGSYNGSVIGSVVDVIDCGELSEELAIEFIVDQFCDGEKEDYAAGDFELEVSSPHPNDCEYAMMIDAGGVYYHFMKI